MIRRADYNGFTFSPRIVAGNDFAFVKRNLVKYPRQSPGGETMAEDPVCGMEVNELTAKHTHDHKGKTYYFCAPGCKFQFSKTPEKFLGGHRIHM